MPLKALNDEKDVPSSGYNRVKKRLISRWHLKINNNWNPFNLTHNYGCNGCTTVYNNNFTAIGNRIDPKKVFLFQILV